MTECTLHHTLNHNKINIGGERILKLEKLFVRINRKSLLSSINLEIAAGEVFIGRDCEELFF